MKRLALVLAASVLGLGCGSSSYNPPPPPTGTLDLSWSFIRTKSDGSGTVTYGCSKAGITSVVVSGIGGNVTLGCADALGDGGAVALSPGTYNAVTVTAYRGGTALFTGTFSGVVILVNQTTSLPAPLDALFAPLQINFGFIVGPTTYTTCAGAGVTAYSVHLVDFAGTSVYANASIACSDPPGVSFPAGNPVDLDEYTIRVIATGPSFEYDSAVPPGCTSPVFNHFAVDTGIYAWNLPVYDVTGGPFCP